METKEEPTFDGTEGKDVNPAAEESTLEDTGEMPEEEEKLRVRYTGTANQRTLSRGDLSGNLGEEYMLLSWTPRSEIDWDTWVEFAGSEERARTVLSLQAHEFELVGPGAAEVLAAGAVEEFSIQAPVTAPGE